MNLATANRSQLVRRGRVLEHFTVAYNSLEGLISIVAGLIAGSVSLVGFGLDSIIEVTSGAAMLFTTTAGCVLPPCDWLGGRPHAGSWTRRVGLDDGIAAAAARAWNARGINLRCNETRFDSGPTCPRNQTRA